MVYIIFLSLQCKREVPDSWTVGDNGLEDHREDHPGRDNDQDLSADLGHDYQTLLKRVQDRSEATKRKYERESSRDRDPPARNNVRRGSASSLAGGSTLIDAARAAGLDLGTSASDPMSSISALLAAAKATGGVPSSSPSAPGPGPTSQPAGASSPSTAQSLPAGPSQGLDLSNPAAAMANVNVSMVYFPS